MYLSLCLASALYRYYYYIYAQLFIRKHVLKLTVITLYFQGHIQQLPIMRTGEGGNLNISCIYMSYPWLAPYHGLILESAIL